MPDTLSPQVLRLLERDNTWTGVQDFQGGGTGTGNVSAAGTLTDHAVVVGDGVHAVAVVGAGNVGEVLTSGGAGADPAFAANVGSPYLQYREQQAQNTSSGTFTSGAWRTRVLNTEGSDVGGYGTLASNQITLTAGTYIVSAAAPGFGVDRHQLRLQNVTDATTLVTGLATFSANSAGAPINQDMAILRGVFTVGASKALELQHQGQTTVATNGFGIPCNFTTEVYAVVEFWKIG